jgi:phosphatidylglycerophosphatase C
MDQQPQDVTLFDLDGVLTTRDTMAALITQRLKRRPFRLLAVLPVYAVALIAGSHRPLAARANRFAVRLTFKGLDDAEYRALATDMGRQLAEHPGFLRKDLVQLCRDAQESSRTVIVTASERHLVEGLLEACGLSTVELIASHIDFPKRFPRLVLHNVGSQKIQSLHAAGVPVENATFYTDSASDLPLALAAAHMVIVHPRKTSRLRLLAALPHARIIE